MHFPLNEIIKDEFGRASGLVAIDKPAGITSHDVVDRVRKVLRTRKVGHAGALDPFATGLLIILVGKATKLSDSFLNTDKEYIADILFGIGTDSADTEGEITGISQEPANLSQLQPTLESFTPEYEQYVSVFSSIKVNGDKLRVLARKFKHHEILQAEDKRFALFYNDDRDQAKKVEIPKHLCKIPYIDLLETTNLDISGLEFYQSNISQLSTSTYPVAKIKVGCSKGTYIRTLGEDIGARLNPPTPSMLIELRRTKVGDIDIAEAMTIDDFAQKHTIQT